MRAFVVSVDPRDAELAADRLWQLGVRAVEERAAGDGRIELWTSVGEGAASIERAASAIGDTWSWRTEEVAEEPTEAWRAHARPMEVGDRLLIVPAWRDGDLGSSAPGRVRILIEPASAFGLGDHPTTELTLAALDREITPGGTVLDVGCGTGVLSVAAVGLGAGAVRAVDVSPAAVEATLDNASRNGVASAIEVDATPAADLDGAYDLVLANILAPVLVGVAADLRRLTDRDGLLVISGVLERAHGHVLDALAPMRPIRTDVSDGWAAVTLVHR